MSLNSSQRKLIAVLALGVLLLSVPFLWRGWSAARELDGKVPVFAGASHGDTAEVFRCLVQRPEGGLKLDITSPNHFADTARGLVVRIEPAEGRTGVHAWIAQGSALTAGEAAQLKSCAAA